MPRGELVCRAPARAASLSPSARRADSSMCGRSKSPITPRDRADPGGGRSSRTGSAAVRQGDAKGASRASAVRRGACSRPKSWPHWLIRCASSTTKSQVVPGAARPSSARLSVAPARRTRRCRSRRWQRAPPHAHHRLLRIQDTARRPAPEMCKLVCWSAISGETTTVGPSRVRPASS